MLQGPAYGLPKTLLLVFSVNRVKGSRKFNPSGETCPPRVIGFRVC
jgi:hypothetical protein